MTLGGNGPVLIRKCKRFRKRGKRLMKISGTIGLVFSVIGIMLLFGCGSGSSGGEAGSAENYPEEPVELIVPFAAGGPSDALARGLAKAVEPELGQPLVVVNRGGAGGTIAATEVANANPDGYTALLPTEAILIAQPVLQDVQYSVDDFRGVMGLVEQPYLLTVQSDSPWQDLGDIQDAGERLEYGHPGVGGYPHAAQEAFVDQAGVQAEGIPFDGNAPALQALLGGQVDTIAAEPSVVIPQQEAGKVRPLATTSPERLDALPNVPTFEEEGYGDATFVQSWSMLVPSDTPDEIVSVLQQAIEKAVKSPEYQNFVKDNYMTPNLVGGEQVIKNMKSDQEEITRLYAKLKIEAAGG